MWPEPGAGFLNLVWIWGRLLFESGAGCRLEVIWIWAGVGLELGWIWGWMWYAFVLDSAWSSFGFGLDLA